VVAAVVEETHLADTPAAAVGNPAGTLVGWGIVVGFDPERVERKQVVLDRPLD